MPMPIDLQVLFTKATNEVSHTVAKTVNAVDADQLSLIQKSQQKSQDADTKVGRTEEYSEEFTRIDSENPGDRGEGSGGNRKKKKDENPPATQEDHRSHLKEDGTGRIIDIID